MSEQQVAQRRREDEARFSGTDDYRFHSTDQCFLCGRCFVQDSHDRRLYYYEDDVEAGNLGYSTAIEPFEGPMGWVCQRSCWDEHCALNDDESIPEPTLFLVKGVRA